MQLKIDREKIFSILKGARRVLFGGLLVASVFSAVGFFFSRRLILLLASHVHVKLYYFNLSEVFFSSVEIALYTGLFLSVPVVVCIIWREFREEIRARLLHGYRFVAFAVLLFYVGSVFCYLVVLPSGITFLLSYQGGAVKAMISTDRFVHFCITMVFAFGAAFELPIILLVLGKFGIVTSKMLTRTRRYAVLIIVIAASVITPTPDIYNMSLLAVPLYVLYEIGILLMRLGERNQKRDAA